MRTIGRHWPRSAPRGDSQVMCDICGVHWRRSQLTRKRDGYLYCPDDTKGEDSVTLSELNAANTRTPTSYPPPGGNYDDDSNPEGVHITTHEGIEL